MRHNKVFIANGLKQRDNLPKRSNYNGLLKEAKIGLDRAFASAVLPRTATHLLTQQMLQHNATQTDRFNS
jgi:hypothetical protein